MKFLTLLFLFVTLSVSAQNLSDYQIVEKDGVKFYEYTVQAGEGVWGISKKFNVSQTIIYKENPVAEAGIKAGQVLLIPVKSDEHKIDVSKKNASDLVHIVLQKQTLYSISKIYGVSVDQLIEWNPDAADGVNIGDEIVISKKSENDTKTEGKDDMKVDNATITHTVQRKETLYSISKLYNVQIHDIITQNPDVENGLKVGMEITISNAKGQVVPTAVEAAKGVKEEVVQLEKTTIEVADNKKIKAKKRTFRKAKREDTIPQVEEVLSAVDTIVAETIDTNDTLSPLVPSLQEQDSLDENAVQICVLLPFMSESKYVNASIKKFIHLYKGMLLSMYNLKMSGRSFAVHTYDTQKSTAVLDSLFLLPEMQNADMIIGPAYAEEVPMVLNFAKGKNIPCLVPIANNIADEYKYDNLVQFNPSLQTIVDDLFLEMFRSTNVKYIFANVGQSNNKGAAVAKLLKNKFITSSTPYTEVSITHENVDTLQTLVAQDSVMLIFTNSNTNQVEPVLKNIKALNLNRMSVFGYDNWSKDALTTCPNTYYYSVFDGSVDISTYEIQYHQWFGYREKDAARSYDIIGYDIFMLALDILVGPKASLYTNDISAEQYLQIVPKLKYENNKGYINERYYLYQYDGNAIVKTK